MIGERNQQAEGEEKTEAAGLFQEEFCVSIKEAVLFVLFLPGKAELKDNYFDFQLLFNA